MVSDVYLQECVSACNIIALQCKSYSVGHHLRYGITQCYLPPCTSEHTQTDRYSRFTYREMVYLSADSHPSK